MNNTQMMNTAANKQIKGEKLGEIEVKSSVIHVLYKFTTTVKGGTINGTELYIRNI